MPGKRLMSVQRPLNQLPLKGFFFCPAAAVPSHCRAARNGAAGTVLCFRLMPCCCLGGFRPMHGFLRHMPARLSGVSIDLRARKALRFFFHFNE